jgi:hypothetical protein
VLVQALLLNLHKELCQAIDSSIRLSPGFYALEAGKKQRGEGRRKFFFRNLA